MADKSFGVDQLDILGTGTPTISAPNQLNLDAHTVAISTSVTVGEGMSAVNISATGISTIAQPANSNPMANWTITNNSASAYRFTGPGQSGSDDNPDLYLVRGHRYIFKHNATTNHPIQIRVASGGAAYTDGITYSDTSNNRTTDGNNLIINLQHDAPAQLFYQCTAHGGMVGNIYTVGGPQVISGVVTATTFVGNLTGNVTGTASANAVLTGSTNNTLVTVTGANAITGEANFTYDGGSNLTLNSTAHDGGFNLLAANNNQETRFRIQGKASDGTGHSFYLNAKRSANRLDIAGGAGANLTVAGSSLNVGVQKTDPESPLHIGSNNQITTAKATVCVAPASGNASMTLRGGSPTIYFDGTSGGNAKLLTDATDLTISDGTLDSAGNERFRITSAGNVGIGTVNPTASNITTALSTNTNSLAVGIVTCKELYVSGIKVTSGGHYADIAAATADGMSHYFPGGSTTSLISNLTPDSGATLGSPSANNTADSYFNNYPYFDFYSGNSSENGYRYTQTTAKWANGPFTIAFWVKPMSSTLESESTFVQLGDHPSGVLRCLYTVSTDQNRQIKTITIGDDSSALNTAVLTTDWNHWVTTYDGSVTRYYLNGSLARSHTHSGNFDVGTGNKYFWIGFGYWNSSTTNKASMSHMSDIGIWNAKALSASTITSIYNAKRTVVGY